MKDSKMFTNRYNHLLRFGGSSEEARIGAHLFCLTVGDLSEYEARVHAIGATKLLHEAIVQMGIAARASANNMCELQALLRENLEEKNDGFNNAGLRTFSKAPIIERAMKPRPKRKR